MKRKLSLIVLLTTVALVVAACGGAATEAPAADTTDAPEAVATEAMAMEKVAGECNVEPPAEAVEVNVLHWPFESIDFLVAEIKKCDDVENITVNVQALDFTAVIEQVNLALSAGDASPFDILHGTSAEFSVWGPNGWVMPLDDLIAKYSDEYDLTDIPAGAFSGASFEGQVYGIPLIGDSQVIAYRSDVFEAAGISVPTTYDEIIAACGALADQGFDVQFEIDFSADWAQEIEFLAALRSYGGDYLNADNTPAFAGPEGVAGLEKMIAVRDACMGDAYLAFGFEAGESGINNGTIAFGSFWATSMASMWNTEETDFADVIKFAPAAAAKTGGPLAGTAWLNYLFIPTTTTNDPDLLFRMIMEAADHESMLAGANLGVMARSSITEGVPNMAAVNATIANGVGAYEINAAIPLVQAALFGELPFVFDGSKTAQEALDAAAAAYLAEATTQGMIK
ncbi:MAG: extracellular solute-binding protein [Anaerolineae bacterium]|nr:extracellular solute-binding protein [Anaerolineae bacterium]